MEPFPLFFRIRAITFTVIMSFSFLWLSLLSVEMFTRWAMSDEISRSLMIMFFLANTVSLILLPILILVKFRVWLDTARLFFLFVLQVGSAAAGTYWNPRIQCPNQSPDDTSVCQLIGVYTVVACWIIPVILFVYSSYFAVVVHFQSRVPVVVQPECHSGTDTEMGSADSHSSWKEMAKEIVGVQDLTTSTSVRPRSLVLPAMVHTSQSSLSQSLASSSQSTLLNTAHRQSTVLSRSSLSQSLASQPALPNTPHRQSTMSSLPDASQQQLPTPSYAVPSQRRSLPAFRHGNEPHIYPVPLMLPTSRGTNAPPPLPPTWSSYSYPTTSPANPYHRSLNFGPRHPDVQFPRRNRWRSKHLSMMPSPSSGGMQGAGESPTNRSKRERLSKPLSPDFM